MNALNRSASSVLPRVTRTAIYRYRYASTSSSAPAKEESYFKKNWLSDPSTYPIIVILSFALCGCCSFMVYKITTCPDVRITKDHKGHILRKGNPVRE